MDGLIVGAMLAILARQAGGLAQWGRAAMVGGPAAFLLWAYITFACRRIPAARMGGKATAAGVAALPSGLQLHSPLRLLSGAISLTLLVAAFGCLLIVAMSPRLLRGLPAKALAVRPLRWLGRYSYGLYVYHFVVIGLLLAAVHHLGLRPAMRTSLCGTGAFAAAAVALSMAVAFASFHLYEKHFLKLKKYFPESGPRTVVPA